MPIQIIPEIKKTELFNKVPFFLFQEYSLSKAIIIKNQLCIIFERSFNVIIDCFLN